VQKIRSFIQNIFLMIIADCSEAEDFRLFEEPIHNVRDVPQKTNLNPIPDSKSPVAPPKLSKSLTVHIKQEYGIIPQYITRLNSNQVKNHLI
jgi:hypothetical protein